MRSAIALSFLVALPTLDGCGGDSPPAGPTDAARPDSGSAAADAPGTALDSGAPTVVAGGDVSGDWCGAVHVTATATVPAGATLTVCAGAAVSLDAGVSLVVDGTLVLAGTATGRITLGSTAGGGRWGGLDVAGTLEGDFVDLSGGTTCITGRATSALRLDDSTVVGCQRSMTLGNGGTFDRTEVRGGNTFNVTGGMLRMSDSVIDLEHDVVPPDCTDWVGASGAILDHVRFTGCHCPIHINASTLEFTVTNSVLDGATNPVMIANSTATFHGNDFIGTSTLVLDIGNNGGITADVAGNYWDGGSPDIGTRDASQFTGTTDFATTRFAGAGPR